MKKYNKGHVDHRVAYILGKDVKQVREITALFLDELGMMLLEEAQVNLPGFGRFLSTTYRHFVPGFPHWRDKNDGELKRPFFRIGFSKSRILLRMWRERIASQWMEDDMEKFGVDEGTDQENLEKKASQGCPICGRKVIQRGRLLMCPEHGTEPFEEEQA